MTGERSLDRTEQTWETSHPAPLIVQHPHIAFIGAYHAEGAQRLDRLFRTVRPWFGQMVVAMQGGTDAELTVANRWADHVLEHEVLGLGEASWEEILKIVREETRCEWVFFMDGDELIDQSLLASLSNLASWSPAMFAKGARIPKRAMLGLADGTILPAPTELNVRMYTPDCVRPVKPHSWIEGLQGEPPIWDRAGAVREHRELYQYLEDQMRYAKLTDYGEAETRRLITETFSIVARTVGVKDAEEEFMAAGGSDVIDFVDMSKVSAE